jgi:DNA-binding NtrC family response regulator
MTLVLHARQRMTAPYKFVRERPAIFRREIVRTELDIRPDLVRSMREVEREAIESALILCGGDRNLAAERLGISRSTFYRRLRDLQDEDAQPTAAD